MTSATVHDPDSTLRRAAGVGEIKRSATCKMTNGNSPLPGEPRTAQRWLVEYGFELAEPTPADIADLDKVMDHDEFWEWASGRVDFNRLQGGLGWRRTVAIIVVAAAVVGAYVAYRRAGFG